jgi:hypothetical protein
MDVVRGERFYARPYGPRFIGTRDCNVIATGYWKCSLSNHIHIRPGISDAMALKPFYDPKVL